MNSDTASPPARLRPRHGWPRVIDGQALRRLAYIVVEVPVAVVGFVLAVVVVWPGMLLALTTVGLALVGVGLRTGRWFASLHRWLSGRFLGEHIEAPYPRDRAPQLLGRVRDRIADPTSWRALLYLVVKLPLTLAALNSALVTWGYGTFLAATPLWAGLGHRGDFAIGSVRFDTWPRLTIVAAVGLGLLLLAPPVTRAVVWLDVWCQRALLGPTEGDRLRRNRARIVDLSAAQLRTIERNLHDGAQAQLVALGMTLSLAGEELDAGEHAAARELVRQAHSDAQRALVEVRDLARGIHPPALDSGLVAALATLAASTPLRIDIHDELTEPPTPAIEGIAYFATAELITNAAKHAGAARVAVTVRTGPRRRLRVEVTDDGRGGAHLTPNGGLLGVRDRIAAVDGTLHIDSAVGGPTTITIDLPEHV